MNGGQLVPGSYVSEVNTCYVFTLLILFSHLSIRQVMLYVQSIRKHKHEFILICSRHFDMFPSNKTNVDRQRIM